MSTYEPPNDASEDATQPTGATDPVAPTWPPTAEGPVEPTGTFGPFGATEPTRPVDPASAEGHAAPQPQPYQAQPQPYPAQQYPAQPQPQQYPYRPYPAQAQAQDPYSTPPTAEPTYDSPWAPQQPPQASQPAGPGAPLYPAGSYQAGPYGAPSYPGYAPAGAYGAAGGGVPPWSPYDQMAQPPYQQGPSPQPSAKSHKVRNSLLVAAVLLAAAGGGVAAGRASTDNSSNASATSPLGGNSGLVPNGSGSSGSSGSAGSGSAGSGSSGSGAFPGFFPSTGGSGSSGSTGSGSSTGVGAGGGSLNATSIASKVDPAVVDINVVLGYQQASAAGTGIVLTSNGEIVTNNHVVNGATAIKVTDIGNGQTYSATVVGTDATDDIAVIQLQGASGLHTANLGDSSSVTTGEPVLAIGNAGGVGGTPSTAAGSVTALNQAITATDDSGGNSEHLTGLVETDAPIQPGDSGGPLVNASGQVLGIDAAAASGNQYQSATSQAYAIPIDHALSIAHQIESGQGSSTIHIGAAAMLGVEVEPTGGTSSGTSQPGALIASIIPSTPAAAAGLAAGDVITSVNGQAINSPNDLSTQMGELHPGDKITIGYTNANGQHETVSLTLGSGPPK